MPHCVRNVLFAFGLRTVGGEIFCDLGEEEMGGGLGVGGLLVVLPMLQLTAQTFFFLF